MGKRVRPLLKPSKSCFRPQANDSSGTKLEHLWEIASKFSSSKDSQENVPVEFDPVLKTKLWKHLLRHKEIIVRVNGQLHYSEAASAAHSDKKVFP
jgi:hypothetical protein